MRQPLQKLILSLGLTRQTGELPTLSVLAKSQYVNTTNKQTHSLPNAVMPHKHTAKATGTSPLSER